MPDWGIIHATLKVGQDNSTAFFQGCEKAGAHLETYRINEEYQTELFHEMRRRRINAHSEMTGENTDKQHPCNAQGNAFYLEAAEHYSYCNNQ